MVGVMIKLALGSTEIKEIIIIIIIIIIIKKRLQRFPLICFDSD